MTKEELKIKFQCDAMMDAWADWALSDSNSRTLMDIQGVIKLAPLSCGLLTRTEPTVGSVTGKLYIVKTACFTKFKDMENFVSANNVLIHRLYWNNAALYYYQLSDETPPIPDGPTVISPYWSLHYVILSADGNGCENTATE